MRERNVVVVMPFGGKERIERRRAILNFKRLEYLVNMCEIKPAIPADETDRVRYSVEVCKTAMDEIPERALRQIHNADIVIALVAEPNPNVIYEVAYRRTLERKLILVVDSPANLPLYLQSWAHHNWNRDEVLGRIDQIAKEPEDIPDLPEFTAPIPDTLKATIQRHDSELQKGLQKALQDIESELEPYQSEAVQHLRGIISDETATFYPCSIVEFEFSMRGEFINPLSPGIVQEFDEEFARLYGYGQKAVAERDRPLTLEKLSKRIESFSDTEDWAQFIREQGELTQTVIKNYGFARASIPIKIKHHTVRQFRNTSYLPCVVAQVIDGNLDSRHKMYLLVVYIELPRTPEPNEHSEHVEKSSHD